MAFCGFPGCVYTYDFACSNDCICFLVCFLVVADQLSVLGDALQGARDELQAATREARQGRALALVSLVLGVLQLVLEGCTKMYLAQARRLRALAPPVRLAPPARDASALAIQKPLRRDAAIPPRAAPGAALLQVAYVDLSVEGLTRIWSRDAGDSPEVTDRRRAELEEVSRALSEVVVSQKLRPGGSAPTTELEISPALSWARSSADSLTSPAV